MIFWKSWSWPSYSRECLLYWLRWRLVAETSSLTVREQKSALPYIRLWMCRHVRTLHWSCLSMPTAYRNSPTSGSQTQNMLNIGHYSQLMINGRLSSMSWKCWGHCDIGPIGCRRGIQSHCIMLSQYTMTCSITWMAWYGLWPRRKPNGRKTCSSLWS